MTVDARPAPSNKAVYILPEPFDGKKTPRWARTVLSRPDDIYIAAATLGSEMAVGMCLGYDGTSALLMRMSGKDRLFVPLRWAEREYPNRTKAAGGIRATIEKMERENLTALEFEAPSP